MDSWDHTGSSSYNSQVSLSVNDTDWTNYIYLGQEPVVVVTASYLTKFDTLAMSIVALQQIAPLVGMAPTQWCSLTERLF